MAGFTAINTSGTAVPEVTECSSKGQPASLTQNSHVDTVTAVCDYLGLGSAGHQTTPDFAAGVQKCSSTSKKRPAANAGKRRSKRRKPSNISDDGHELHTTPSQGSSETLQPAAQEHLSAETPTDPGRQTRKVRNVDHESVSSSIMQPKQSLHEYLAFTPPVTTMDALGSTPVRTSFDSGTSRDIMSRPLYHSVQSKQYQEVSSNLSTTQQASALRSNVDPHVEATGRTESRPPQKSRIARSAPRPSRKAKKVALNKIAGMPRKAADVSTGAPTIMHDATAPQDSDSFDIEAARSAQDVANSSAHEFSTSVIPSTALQHSRATNEPQLTSEDEFEDTIEFDEDAERRAQTPTARSYKQNLREVDEHETYDGALLSDAERQFLDQHRPSSASEQRKAIVRQPFPQAVLDRSPITGTSRATVLRTCFRLGEALNVGHQAVRMNIDVTIELYARVTSSWREEPSGRKQHFVFGDLFHGKSPQLEGTFEFHSQANLWNTDSETFLDAAASSTMCRAIGKMKRDAARKWRLEIRSIWEASWEDVDWAAGIADASA
ncbi:hypothetical protein CBER1_01872 [Cercospora berteroae]|uniref:Uncharacterized protein n=1 Tax=Cercospora berteroae TaxID=357750 RepID=A0A2S6BQ33_9PEZI|nr:hypothetical protein CBER1_01872 [Cercospora berteroae]